jgi:tetratricopeptide (TPR) repeat protein
MDRVRWKTINEIFHAALEVSSSERDAFLSSAADGDTELKAEVEVLLKADSDAGSYIESPLMAPITFSAVPLKRGDVLCGRFRIVRALAEGGMGQVFEAFDSELAVPIALKVIKPEIATNAEALARFRQEVRLARRITHPNICRTFDIERDARTADPIQGTRQDVIFLTMEFLKGETLSARIGRTGPVPLDEALSIARQVGNALAAACSFGVIHRDIKPSNIMLVPESTSSDCQTRAVVTDFGLARLDTLTSSGSSSPFSDAARPVGTLAYMAPEQLEGKQVTSATDIYAFGLVLFEMVTGHRAFPSDNFLTGITQRLKGAVPNPGAIVPDLPEAWRRAIEGCLRIEANERFKSAAEVIAVLEGRKVRRSPILAGTRWFTQKRIVYAIILATACGAVFFLWAKFHGYEVPNQRAMSWYEEGSAALREGEYVQATNELQQAVNFDKDFAVAHARLAEAWAELDSSGPAQSEMIEASAPERQRGLPDRDRRYIDAVRATLVHDYAGAVRDQLAILDMLPKDERGFGYVDLGRAQEKAGDIPGALKSYQAAAKLTPDNPAPFVHLGVLLGRQRDDADAEQAFERAEDLYRKKGNLEGVGEVDYQRGHYENELGQPALAEPYLTKCREIAQEIPSAQLEVRALTQLSNVEYMTPGQSDRAIEYANRAYDLASENGLEYWATDALIRKGTALLIKGDYAASGNVLLDALQRAEQNQHPRLKANAELTLASLRDQQGSRDDQIRYAQDALQYYKEYGFLVQARGAITLLIRAQEARDDYTPALQSAMTLLELAQKLNSASGIQIAQETIGNVLYDLERFPEALMHYEGALSTAQSIKADASIQALHCAGMLWRLGHYDEADAMLRSIDEQTARQPNLASAIEQARAGMLLSQGRFAESSAIATAALRKPVGMPPLRLIEFQRLKTLAEARSGRIAAAKPDAQRLLEMAQRQDDGDYIAKAELVQAEVLTKAHSPDDARTLAEAAYRQFAANGEAESQWLSLLCEAQAAAEQGDYRSAESSAKQGLDILRKIEQDWGSPVFKSYSAREDIQSSIEEMEKLAAQ